MCIGPVRPDMTLRDRLLRAGVISSSALQDTSAALDIAQSGETRIALTLMDLGYISHEDLRAWAMKEASGVIQVLLTWPGGEIYFEDGMQPPADRLLVALSPCSLLPSTQSATTSANNTQDEAGEVRLQNRQPQNELLASVQAQSAGLLSASQLITEAPPIYASFPSPVSSVRTVNMFGDADAQNFPQLSPPMRISQPLPPLRIDTSYMRPEMVLIPLDLSALRQQGLHLPITPEQWFVLTRVDGRTTLQCACLELGMPADILCQVAGELIALGVIHVSIPMQQVSKNELPPVSRRCPNGAMVVMVQPLFLDEVGLLILSLYSQVVRSTLQMASMLPSGVAVSLIRNMVTIVNTLKIIKKGIQKLSGCLLFALLYLWPIKHHCFC